MNFVFYYLINIIPHINRAERRAMLSAHADYCISGKIIQKAKTRRKLQFSKDKRPFKRSTVDTMLEEKNHFPL